MEMRINHDKLDDEVSNIKHELGETEQKNEAKMITFDAYIKQSKLALHS